ncbi:MAG: PHP domain-containing protein [Alphaproteobacteria bacterium]|nr:PHP domain-containing protein [Alphaproteobacteria bacterium]
MQNFSYHTHTVFSDGQNSIEEMLEKAVQVGYQEIGISDHLIINECLDENGVFHRNPLYQKHYMYRNDFVATKELVIAHLAKIKELAKKFPLKVYAGFEVDYFSYDGWEEKFRNLIAGLEIDYMIIGNHYCYDEQANKLLDAAAISNYSEDKATQQRVIAWFFKNYQNAIQSGLFDFTAHLTYICRSGVCDVADYEQEFVTLLELIKKQGMAIELNTAKSDVLAHFMPNKFLLEKARDLDIPLVISDDCHNKDLMTAGYDVAEKYLIDLSYKNRWKMK